MSPSTVPVALLSTVLAQFDDPRVPGAESFVGAFLLETLFTFLVVGILGAVVVAVLPEFVDEGATYVRTEPVTAFAYGLAAYVVTVVLVLLLVITVVGILVVIPGLLLLAIVGLVANAVALVGIGAVLVSAPDEVENRWSAFLAGLTVWAIAGSVPVLGELFTFVVGAMGFGYVVAYGLDSRSNDDRRLGDVRRRRGGAGSGTDGPTDSSASTDAWGGDAEESGAGSSDGTEDDRFRNLAAADAEREEREQREREQQERDQRQTERNEGGETADGETRDGETRDGRRRDSKATDGDDSASR